MKMHSLISLSLLVTALLAGPGPAHADSQRSYAFAGVINSFDRSNGMLVIDDQVFRISDKARVIGKNGQTALLSDIRPGVKVGLYPKTTAASRQDSSIDAIWILPADWKATRSHTADPVRLH